MQKHITRRKHITTLKIKIQNKYLVVADLVKRIYKAGVDGTRARTRWFDGVRKVLSERAISVSRP